jgi:hypothetical protein
MGCANRYKVTTFEGVTFNSQTAPKLERGAYHFEEDGGKMIILPYISVKSVSPL